MHCQKPIFIIGCSRALSHVSASELPQKSHRPFTLSHTMTTNIFAPNSTFNNASRDIVNNYYPSTSALQQAPFNDAPIGLLSAHFTGRQRELALIAKAFGRLRVNAPLRCILYGNQGVGKSQLTYEWARSTFDGGDNTYILWISATTVEKLDQGYTKLLHRINHRDRSHSDQNVRLLAARQWLEDVESGNWLLVLDNVSPQTVGFLREHLPHKNGRGSILFSTRTRHVADILTSTSHRRDELVEVSLLDVKDGAQLFLGHFEEANISLPLVKVEQIVKSLGCLPLAIAHAAAFMKQSAGTLDDMLALYKSQDKFKVISWENTLTEYEHQSVAATFIHQLQDLERQFPDASRLLKVLAYFDPENIPLDMLITGVKDITIHEDQFSSKQPPSITHSFLRNIKEKGKGRASEFDTTPKTPSHTSSLLTLIKSPMQLRETIAQLQNQSLVACHDSSRSTSLRIHDLIQLVILETSKQDGSEQACFELAVQLACHAFDQIEDHRSPTCWPQCEAVVPHIQSLTSRQDISSQAKLQLLGPHHRFAFYLRSRGQYGEAEKVYGYVLSQWEQIFGSEDWRTLHVMYDLGFLYYLQGRNSDAQDLLERVLQSDKKQFGSEHPNTLRTMRELANVYRRQHRFDEAEKMLNQVVAALANQFGLEHISTVNTKHALASVYQSQRRYTEAETLLKQVLQSNEKLLGREHRDTLSTMHELARVYHSQKRYGDAELLYKRVLESREKLLGSNHPHTLTTQHNLGRLYHSQQRSDEAEALLVHVLSRREEVLGHSHPHTKSTRDELTSIRTGRQRRSESMMKSCMIRLVLLLGCFMKTDRTRRPSVA